MNHTLLKNKIFKIFASAVPTPAIQTFCPAVPTPANPNIAKALFCAGIAVFAMSGTVHAAGDAAAGQSKSAVCAGCHGPDGNSPSPAFPKLAGQTPEYLVKQLKDFKSGARKDPMMSGLAAPLSDDDISNLAAYFAQQKVSPSSAAAGPEVIKRGERLYRGGNAKFGVSACMSCHGPSGHGIPPRFPKVSGQHAAYTTKQLRDFKNDARVNDGDVMTRIAFRMSEAEIQAVSEYMAGLH
jgi:cytochrome c553